MENKNTNAVETNEEAIEKNIRRQQKVINIHRQDAVLVIAGRNNQRI